MKHTLLRWLQALKTYLSDVNHHIPNNLCITVVIYRTTDNLDFMKFQSHIHRSAFLLLLPLTMSCSVIGGGTSSDPQVQELERRVDEQERIVDEIELRAKSEKQELKARELRLKAAKNEAKARNI